MIDDIVEMILKVARARKGHDLTFHVYRVCMEIQSLTIDIMDKAREEERRIKEDESKGRFIK
ncbi:hypothetical protein ES703_113005 [subsurface metagenome]